MLKNIAILEVKKGERIYRMELENDSPLGECFDALSMMQAYVLERLQCAQKAVEEKKPAEEPKPE